MDIIPDSSQLSEVSRPALIVLLFGLLAFAGISIPLRTSSASKAAERNIIRISVPNPPLALTVNNTSDDADASAGDGVCDTDLVTSGEQCSLRAAIQEANASLIDTTISFDAGLINSSITLESALPDLTANVTITGLGVTSLTIQRDSAVATPEFRIFRVAPSVTAAISGLKISNGKLTGTNNGGGLLNDGALTVTSCNLENNSADQSGGAIYNNGTSLTLTDCNIGGLSAGQGNIANRPGRGLFNQSRNLSVSGGEVFGTGS